MTPSETGRGVKSPLRPWLVTRPLPEAGTLAQDLAALGLRAIVSPALSIRPVAPVIPDSARDTPIDGMIFTSRNGVRFGADLAPDRRLPVFAVGDATAEEARHAGFERVTAADGDARSVVALIRKTFQRPEGARDERPAHLLHPTGIHRSADLEPWLLADGIRVTSVTTYDAALADRLSPEAYGSLSDGTLSGVLFYSPRTARHVAHLIAANGMDERVSGVYAVCLSGNVAEPIRHLPWRKIVVAHAPTTEAMLNVVSHLST